ncbi:hypothetical protein E5358_04910 [Palleniella muris]|uniref:Uncharacterized protein n=1 Tax=Palleniella muris TaxID=3038145 RepID=A0AC61QS40_9BACT|nr:hypothetical protein [Palleniella muris]TGX83003.1 hypothetical protein E5358_04910 [Palleniella muris]
MTIKEACHYSVDNGCYPVFFSTMVGLDFKLKTRPELYAKTASPRKVVIEITTFRHVCFGAEHYYASIKADGIMICEDVTAEKGNQIRMHCGYLCEEFNNLPASKKDLYAPKYTISVCRAVSEKELAKDPIRWQGYRAGDLTNAFYTEDAALRRAQAIVKARFSNMWQVSIEKD